MTRSRMFAALLTTFFFALSVVLARRSTAYLGPQRANLARQVIALVFLGLWAHTFGQGFGGPTFALFFISGIVGFGLGDWALFEALPRLGPGLTALISQCFAVPIAAITERLWLGTMITPLQVASSAVILLGVAIAIAPARESAIPHGHRFAGIAYGVVAACGQAWGAVISRFGFHRADAAGFHLDGITAAYQRLWGGALSIALLLLIQKGTSRWRTQIQPKLAPDWRHGAPWVVANALTGATLGVSCYQWALHVAPSAVVLPIVATTPLVVMLLALAFEGTRPTRRALVGSVLAVAGVVALLRSA